MEEVRGLVQGLWKEIESNAWYRQRFDACPHFMFFLGDAHTSTIQDTAYPFGQKVAYAGFSHNRADWYHSVDALRETTDGILQVLGTSKELGQKMIQDFLPWEQEFYRECRKLEQQDLKRLSDEELLATYDSLAERYTKKLNSSPLIDGFALSTDTMIADKIRQHLQAREEEERFATVFPALTAPTFLSFLQEEEIALLQLTEKIEQFPDREEESVTEHQKNYFWIQNNYVKDHIITHAVFVERVEEYRHIDRTARIQELSALAVVHRQEKDDLIQELVLPEDVQALLALTDDFNAWQDERKKGTFWATHYFSMLLEEFSRRTQLPLDLLKYALPPEMGQVLAGVITEEQLQERKEYCIIFWTRGGKYEVIVDRELIDTMDKIGTGEINHNQELKGFVASRGKVTGRVKVLESAEEVYKIERGDILVAVMTRPDYLPGMQKAAAFVTDEGGITCHAAIVAREMKKPCIIGTKIATQVLKDGDMVEIDAENGIVKIIT